MKGRSCVCMTNILHTMKTYAVCQQKTKNKQKYPNNLFAYRYIYKNKTINTYMWKLQTFCG